MPLLGAGRHHVTVVSHILRKSSGGTPSVAVLFESTAQIGDRITWDGYLTDAALERTIASLRILGWDPAEHDGKVESLHGTDILKGAEAEIVVELEEYNGQQRPKVKWVNAVGGGGLGEGMAAEDVMAFSASLRQKVLSAQKPTPNTKPGPARQPAAVAANSKPLSEPDDELPF
jgi:hypothetical protein